MLTVQVGAAPLLVLSVCAIPTKLAPALVKSVYGAEIAVTCAEDVAMFWKMASLVPVRVRAWPGGLAAAVLAPEFCASTEIAPAPV